MCLLSKYNLVTGTLKSVICHDKTNSPVGISFNNSIY